MPTSVALYVPNLIGYVRIALALMAFAVADTSPGVCVGCYFLSFVSDELDGRFARLLGQTSTLGAVMDCVTDRVATTGLAAVVYSRLVRMGNGATADIATSLALFGLVALDIFSHWFHMYAILATKGFGTSHKETDESQPWLLRMYYTKRIFMGFCCVCVEVLYLALYVLTFSPTSSIARSIIVVSAPGFILKNVANCVQLWDAAKLLIALDSVGRTGSRNAPKRQTSKRISRSRSRSRGGS